MKATETLYATIGLLLCSLGMKFLAKAENPDFPRNDFARGDNDQPTNPNIN